MPMQDAVVFPPFGRTVLVFIPVESEVEYVVLVFETHGVWLKVKN